MTGTLCYTGCPFDSAVLTVSKSPISSGIQRHRNALMLPKPPSCGPVKPTTRIMGGSNAAVGEFPWMVLLKVPS